MSSTRLWMLCWALTAVTPPAVNGSAPEPGNSHATHAVAIENMVFQPAQLSVHAGERIVFMNKDLFPHTVTAEDKSFDSGSIAPNGTWTYRAIKSGQFAYKCSFHPSMTGTLVVR